MRAAVVSPLLIAAAATAAAPPPPSDDGVHARAIVVDTHADTTQLVTYQGIDIGKSQPDAQVDLAKAAAGGLDAQFFSIFVLPMRFKPDQFFTEATRQIDALDKLARDNPKRLRVARTAADVQ